MVESVIQIKNGIMVSADANVEKHLLCAKYYIWNLATRSFENGKYLASVIDDLVIMCNETIETTKTISTNFNEKSNL